MQIAIRLLLGAIPVLQQIAMSMLLPLLTEKFVKRAVLIAWEKKVKSTTDDKTDDDLYEAVKDSWGM